MIFKNVLTLRAGVKDDHGHMFTEEALQKLVEQQKLIPLLSSESLSFRKDSFTIGNATSFRKLESELKCDIFIGDEYAWAPELTPAIEGKIIKKHKMVGDNTLFIDEIDLKAISLVIKNADEGIPKLKESWEK